MERVTQCVNLQTKLVQLMLESLSRLYLYKRGVDGDTNEWLLPTTLSKYALWLSTTCRLYQRWEMDGNARLISIFSPTYILFSLSVHESIKPLNFLAVITTILYFTITRLVYGLISRRSSQKRFYLLANYLHFLLHY